MVVDILFLTGWLVSFVLCYDGLCDLNLNVALSIVSLLMILSGCILTCIAYIRHQRQPTEDDLKQVIATFSSH